MPKRVQRKRTKGWKKPEGAVYVGRGSKWGNPFTVEPLPGTGWKLTAPDDPERNWGPERRPLVSFAVYLFEEAVLMGLYDVPGPKDICVELAGKDLMCWCPLDQPCHADVLLEIANDGDD